MATFQRKSVYKGGGASFVLPGVRGMIYMSPSLFQGDAPESVEVDFANMSTPDAAKLDREAHKAAGKAEREAKKAERENVRIEARQARENARAARVEERDQQRDARRTAAEERRAARKTARTGDAEAPVEQVGA